MEVDRNNEKLITDLYRHYQQSRDDIDQQVLFNINKAMKVYLNSSASVNSENSAIYQHKVMDAIREQAHQQYIKERITSHSIHTKDLHSKAPGLSSKLAQIFYYFLTQLKKPVWASALAGLLIISFYLTSYNVSRPPIDEELINPYRSAQLIDNDDFVVKQINTQVDWQYGFVIENPAGRNAFMAGAYLVDLQNLNQARSTVETKLLLEQLSQINARIGDEPIQNAIEQYELQPNLPESFSKLNETFKMFYKSRPEVDFFEFGKWIEFNYLQTKLALEYQDISLYNSDIQVQQDFIKAFKLNGVYPEFINDDLNDLITMYSMKNTTLEQLNKQYELLDKLRTLLF